MAREDRRRPVYLGEPTLGQVMRRPQWLLALLFALALAAGFALLGQWQMGSAFKLDAEQAADTETSRPLGAVSGPGTGVTEEAAGVVVTLEGSFAPGDYSLVEQRYNDGEAGVWVVGHLLVEAAESPDTASLAVAIGWAADRGAAEQALQRAEGVGLDAALHLEGRFMPPEGPELPGADEDPRLMRTMAPGQLANQWAPFDGGVYAGYLVLHPVGDGASMLEAVGLDPIDSVPPLPEQKVNWLNLFYAVEWVVFAGFAVFFWYRLTRDAWEKEHELKLLEAGVEPGAESVPDGEPGTGSSPGARA